MKKFFITLLQIMRAGLFMAGMVLIIIEAPTDAQQWKVTGAGILCFVLCALPEVLGILPDICRNGVKVID